MMTCWKFWQQSLRNISCRRSSLPKQWDLSWMKVLMCLYLNSLASMSGTDGAAVMTGRRNRVAKQLTDIWPWLLCAHCAAHRLSLACKDAADNVSYMRTFKEMHLYFRNSANHTAAMKSAANALGITDLKVKEVKDTKWLSQHQAILNLQRNISAVLAVLAEEAEVRKCPTA